MGSPTEGWLCSCPHTVMGKVNAKVGVRAVERYSEHAFDGVAFLLRL